MQEKEKLFWRKFLETGQIADYLRYRRQAEQPMENPRRRIEESSRYKHFY